MDPTTRFVRSLPGEYFMTREVAKMLDVSRRTLSRLSAETKDLPEEQKLGPSFYVHFGKIAVYLYTTTDIERLRAYLAVNKQVHKISSGLPAPVGRPRRWTPAQRKTRNRLYARANYYRKRAREVEARCVQGWEQARDHYLSEAEKCQAQLTEMENA